MIRGLRLSPSWFLCVVGGIALAVAAVETGWDELAYMGAFGVGLASISLLLAVAGDLPVRATHRVGPERVAAGGQASVRIDFSRRPWRGMPLRLIERFGDRDLAVQGPRKGGPVMIGLPTDHRGVFDVGPLACRRSDPFGLVQRTRTLTGIERLIVHPRLWPLLRAPSSMSVEMDGPTVEEQIAGSEQFNQLREYLPGDEPRHIHWLATARVGTLMVRQFVDTARPDVAVVVDDLDGSYDEPEEFEAAMEVAASLVAAAAGEEAPVHLFTLSGHGASIGRGDAPTLLLDLLAALQPVPAPDEDLDRLATRVAGTACLLVTGHATGARTTTVPLILSVRGLVRGMEVLTVGAGPAPELVDCLVSSGRDAPEALSRWSRGTA